MSWIRRAAQAVFLFLFVILAWSASYPPGAVNENIFLRFDPLAAFVAASWSGLWAYLLPAWLLLLITAPSGRFFCGWVCPLGTVLEWMPSLRGRRRRRFSELRAVDVTGKVIGEGERRIRLKYAFLALFLALSLAGINLAWAYDPLVIANRAVGLVLSGGVPFIFIGLVVLAVLAGPRFWCREMCPLGACLSLTGMLGSRLPAGASPLSLVKEEEFCIHCGRCSLACPFEITEVADTRRTGRLAIADCVLCGDCVAACPCEGALSLRFFGYALSSSRGRKRGRDGMSPESGEKVLVKCGG
ncbi:4Fe-4S binding protein [Candidatus Solincola sp.]